MVSRSNTSKTIRRRTGGAGKKTGAGTNVRDTRVGTAKDLAEGKAYRGTINRPGDWEMVPGTGTSPYNPPKWRKKKKPNTKVTKENLPPPEGYEGDRGEKFRMRMKAKDDSETPIDPDFLLPGAKAGGKVSKSKGGTVKKRKGGTPKRKYSKGGSVSRRGGGKIMIGYKAGGKV